MSASSRRARKVPDPGIATTPRFGFSIVAATFATQGVAIGLSLGAYPVFLASLEAELGINRVQASAGIPVVLAAGALLSPWIGREVDRGSPRKIMFAGVALVPSCIRKPTTSLPAIISYCCVASRKPSASEGESQACASG